MPINSHVPPRAGTGASSTAIQNVMIVACIVVATLSAMLGGVAAMQYWAIIDGSYDPVADDGLAPELVPPLKTRLWRIAIIGGGGLLISLPYLLYRLHRCDRYHGDMGQYR